jgi:hypothetical protein
MISKGVTGWNFDCPKQVPGEWKRRARATFKSNGSAVICFKFRGIPRIDRDMQESGVVEGLGIRSGGEGPGARPTKANGRDDNSFGVGESGGKRGFRVPESRTPFDGISGLVYDIAPAVR